MYNNINLLTFAKGNFIDSQRKLKNHLDKIGIEKQIHLTQDDLPEEFVKKNEKFFKLKRGYGYWVWKPFIILRELEKINKDEILIYIDSTDLPEKLFFDDVIESIKKLDYYLINRGYNHGQWTKRDTFVLMNCDNELYYNQVQLEAGIIGLKNTEFNINLIKEWSSYMENENILTDIPNICGLPNINNFIDHRHDQSILTNLSIRYGLISKNLNIEKIKYNYNQPTIY